MPDDLSPGFEPEIAVPEQAKDQTAKPRRRRKPAADAPATEPDSPASAPDPVAEEKPRRRRRRAAAVEEEPVPAEAAPDLPTAPASEPVEDPSFPIADTVPAECEPAAEAVEHMPASSIEREPEVSIEAEADAEDLSGTLEGEPLDDGDEFQPSEPPLEAEKRLPADELRLDAQLSPMADEPELLEEYQSVEDSVPDEPDAELRVAAEEAEPESLEVYQSIEDLVPDEPHPDTELQIATEEAEPELLEEYHSIEDLVPDESHPDTELQIATEEAEPEPLEESRSIEDLLPDEPHPDTELRIAAEEAEPEPLEESRSIEDLVPDDPHLDAEHPIMAEGDAEPQRDSEPVTATEEAPLPDTSLRQEEAEDRPIAEAPVEPHPLEMAPLTEPPENGPPLVPLAEPAEAIEAEAPAAPSSSKAWGPVRGAIETAMSNIGPLLPISRAEQLRRQVAAAIGGQFGKIAALADSLILSKLPWLRPVGQKIAAFMPHSRSALIGGGLLIAAAAGGIGVRLLLPAPQVAAPAPVAAIPPLPTHVARRLGQELEMSVVPLPKGSTALFAAGKDQLDSALALSRREAAGDGVVISLDALAAASRQVLAWYGLDPTISVKPATGPILTFQGEVPDALYPLARAALDNIGQLLAHDPILHTVQIRDQIARSDTALLRAIFIGEPKSIVYTADGAREIGQPLYGGFTIKEIEPDDVVLAPARPGSEITITIPLREPSAATVHGSALTALPDRSAIVLAQQSTASAKE